MLLSAESSHWFGYRACSGFRGEQDRRPEAGLEKSEAVGGDAIEAADGEGEQGGALEICSRWAVGTFHFQRKELLFGGNGGTEFKVPLERRECSGLGTKAKAQWRRFSACCLLPEVRGRVCRVEGWRGRSFREWNRVEPAPPKSWACGEEGMQ